MINSSVLVVTCLLFSLDNVIQHVLTADVEDSDEIHHLPGLAQQPTFRHYSGYLQPSPTIFLHYWLVESQSDPLLDPVVLWLNGGPGCSSLFGLLNENGPYLMNDDATLRYNPYAWNKAANVLYLEAPGGVGFSFTTDGNVATNDDEVADNNYNAMIHFFKKYPQFRGKGLYITGESYSGIYIPTLALRLMQNPTLGFKGILVGNGLTHYELNDNSLLYYAHFHSLLGESLWATLNSKCCPHNSTSYCMFTKGKNLQCLDAIHEATDIIDYGLNVYNMYAPCHGGVKPQLYNRINSMKMDTTADYDYLDSFEMLFANDPYVKKQRDMRKLKRAKERSTSTPGCYNITAATSFLNRPEVRRALHISPEIVTWGLCSDEVLRAYTRVYFDLSNVYEKLIQMEDARIWIYNGDFDLACNYLGQEWFFDSLRKPLSEGRRPWFYLDKDGTHQIGGYTKSWLDGRVVFATVRGSGHMVPQDKPEQAFQMLTRFLNQQSL